MSENSLNTAYLLGAFNNNLTRCKLPNNSEVLNYFMFKYKVLKKSIRSSATEVIKEVQDIWSIIDVPLERSQHVTKKLESLFIEWRNLNKSRFKKHCAFHISKIKEFTDKLNKLFDVRLKKKSSQELSPEQLFSLVRKNKGQHISLSINVEDNEPPLESIENVVDKNALSRALSSTSISFEEVSSCSGALKRTISNFEDELSEYSNDKKKINIMTPELTSALDRSNISSRNATYNLVAAAKSLGHDPTKINISHRVIHRERIKMRKMVAADIKENSLIVDNVILHWDGKLLPDCGGPHKVDRLPIVLSGLNYEQLLGVPKLDSGTGFNQAKTIVKALNRWNIVKNVKGLCFDTAYVNSGDENGAAVQIERALKTKILWFPCRHHIYELVMKSVAEVVWHVSSGPSPAVFNRFKQEWTTIDQTKYETGMDDQYVKKILNHKKQDILEFISLQMEEFQPRGDYKELLNLTCIFLGEILPQGISFKTPGAHHHARWLAKAIYCLKIFLFKKQFKLAKVESSKLTQVCIFIVDIYIKGWYSAPSSVQAPYQDFMFLKSLLDLKHINAEMSNAACTKFLRHLWYLSEDLAALSFFDERIPTDVKSKMVKAIKCQQSTTDNTRKFYMEQKDLKSFFNKDMSNFITQKSMILFEKFNLPSSFLDLPVNQWEADKTYQDSLKIIRAIKVTNDIAERGVALINKYNEGLTYDEEQRQFLLQVVADHRKKYPDCSKKNLCF
ncbi:unnamed protein product [Brassicogethes aeneus]|uniref:Uncharacterized protein n=1 Tax=Brassicogethes aeneus TaxID=1431903 RepID=A0A9P0B6D8_BRAAE|nr:unnamed protein product [Brassicogethes aeneus]